MANLCLYSIPIKRRITMTNKKDLKSNSNYFLKDESMKFVGIGLMILAAVLFYFGRGWIGYILMCVSLPAGFLLFLLSTFGRSSESDIDEYIKKATENLEINVEEDKNFEKRLSKHLPVETAEGYEYSDGVMLKKAKNGSIRSSVYTKSILYPLDTALFISYRTISLVSEDKTEEKLEIPYSDINSLRFEEEHKQLKFRKNSFRTRIDTLVIEYSDNKTLCLPIQSSVQTDTFVERINELIAANK